MDSKEIRIANLQKQILEIENERDYAFELVKVVPDCGGGIRDDEKTIVVSMDIEKLAEYSKKEFEYVAKLNQRNPIDGKSPCETWYMIKHTKIEIL